MIKYKKTYKVVTAKERRFIEAESYKLTRNEDGTYSAKFFDKDKKLVDSLEYVLFIDLVEDSDALKQ